MLGCINGECHLIILCSITNKPRNGFGTSAPYRELPFPSLPIPRGLYTLRIASHATATQDRKHPAAAVLNDEQNKIKSTRRGNGHTHTERRPTMAGEMRSSPSREGERANFKNPGSVQIGGFDRHHITFLSSNVPLHVPLCLIFQNGSVTKCLTNTTKTRGVNPIRGPSTTTLDPLRPVSQHPPHSAGRHGV